MVKNRSIIAYLLVFLVLSVLLKIVGVFDITITELAGYSLVFFGISAVYISMGENNKKLLFIGSVVFLVGVELFITSNYDVLKLSHIVLPSIFFILGTAFLILFIDDTANKLLLAISLIFLASGVYFFVRLGVFNPADFFKAVLSISQKYWPIIIILIALILFIKKNSKEKK